MHHPLLAPLANPSPQLSPPTVMCVCCVSLRHTCCPYPSRLPCVGGWNLAQSPEMKWSEGDLWNITLELQVGGRLCQKRSIFYQGFIDCSSG
jgi:hypothetical protein